MLSTTDMRRGLKIELDNIPYEVIDFLHVKPGKGGAFVRTKLRNILNGSVVEQTFRAGEKFPKPDLESRSMQYLYRDSSGYVFMDLENYEQLSLTDEHLGDKGGYLKDGQEVKALFYKGRAIDVDLPVAVILVVTKTDPGIKGDTVTGATKPATLESGKVIQVPLFINEGTHIKVDTRNGAYLGRE